MFDFVVEIDTTEVRKQIKEHSAKKLIYFKEMNIISESHSSDFFSYIGYSHDYGCASNFENDTRIIVIAGKVYPTNRTQDTYGKNSQLSLNEVLEFYDLHDSDIVDYIKGNYALIVWNKREKNIFASVGKSGLLKLYYFQTQHGVIFATTLDSIAQHPLYKKKINYIAIYEALLFGYPLGSITYCHGIELLDNYSYINFNAQEHKLDIVLYYDLAEKLPVSPSYNWKETFEQTPKLFNKSIDVITKGESRINAALTGGFDSRTILSRLIDYVGEMQFYSWGATKQSTDVSIPESICKKLGLEYIWVQLGAAFLSNYGKYADMLLFFTDGLGNIKRCNQMYSHYQLSSYARLNLTGAIGSELLRPNNGLDTNIFPAMKDIIFADTLNIDRLESYEYLVSNLLSPDLIHSIKSDVMDHISIELHKFMRYKEPHLNLYNYTISQSLWKFFGQEFHAARVFEYVVTPYSDDDFVEFIVQTPVPSLNKHAFERNAKDLKAGQLFYLPIIDKNMPQLLDVPTTRGYTPRQLRSKFYPINILIPFIWSRLHNKHFMAEASYNAKDWNRIEYSKNLAVINYSDKELQHLEIDKLNDAEYSIKKWIMTIMDMG